MKKKVCKHDRLFVEDEECPLCKGRDFVTVWKGRIHILDVSKSEIAKRVGINQPGEYALKIS